VSDRWRTFLAGILLGPAFLAAIGFV